MELDTRKLQILKAIIDEYILSASPVGSRSISRRDGFNLSSATIRNEMADLEDLGYLEQPHTSAGRIPSDKAYRLYVNSIVHRAQLSPDEIKLMRAHFDSHIDEIEQVMKQTAHALSAVTQYTAMVLPPMLAANRLRRIQIVPLTEGKALVVIVTDTGFAKDAIIRVPDNMTGAELDKLSHMMSERFYDCRMDVIGERVISELGDEFYSRREFVNAMLEAVERKLSPTARNVELSGTTNMLTYPEYADMNKAKTFLAAVEGRDALYNMLTKASAMEFSITIGMENEHEQLKDCSIVTATYRIGDEPMGSIGVIGPTRMHYGKVLSVLEFMRRSLGDVLTNYMEEDRR